MITKKAATRILYKALVDRSASHLGKFVVGVKTTGILCIPTCTAKKPKIENCDFFETMQEGLLSGYRPCKRCHPIIHGIPCEQTIKVAEAIESNPTHRWKERDFIDLGIDSRKASSAIKRNTGLTLVEYARARRLGLAFKFVFSPVRPLPSASSSRIKLLDPRPRIKDPFDCIMPHPSKVVPTRTLTVTWVTTPIGPMLSVSNPNALYLLEFIDRRGLETELITLRKRLKSRMVPGQTPVSDLLQEELNQYFNGKLSEFKTPIEYIGSKFQRTVWDALRQIPAGERVSYSQLAKSIGKPKASRAVANANGANILSILVPCHRVIRNDGSLGGYGGGLHRKHKLLEDESTFQVKLARR